MATHSHAVVIVGGGAAGISVAAQLPQTPNPTSTSRSSNPRTSTTTSRYGRWWAGGVFPREASERNEADFIPNGTTWIQDRVDTFEPEQKQGDLV